MNNEPSQIEIDNSKKILEYLNDIEGISFEVIREDIFKVSNGTIECIVDVEETIVCLQMDICDAPDSDYRADEYNEQIPLYCLLLKENANAIHGKFCILDGKIVIKDNLEFENLDANEFEASLAWVFALATKNLEEISNILI